MASSLGKWLNPFHVDPGAQRSKLLHRRLLRALAISTRNFTMAVLAVGTLAQAVHVLPAGVLITIGLAVLLRLGWAIRARDASGQPVSPNSILVFFGLSVVVLAYLRSLADGDGLQPHYDYVIRLDSVVLGTVPTVWLQEHLYHYPRFAILDAYALATYLSYFFVPFLAAVFLWHNWPVRFRLYLTAFLVTMVTGTAYVALVPTAPPWMAANNGHLPEVFRIVRIVVDRVAPGAYQNGYAAAGINEVASFPSFHMSESLLVVMAAWGYGRWPRRIGIVYALSMGFSLVYLGEHYVADVLAGAALGLASWRCALSLTPQTRPSIQAPESAPGAAVLRPRPEAT